ncbi:hypothetical protein [Roseicyclus elongatus]|nr:hypothetical protein [Roseibacterium elongatum]
MAKHDAAWTPDTDAAPTTHPKTREQLVQENRARRETEPAAAPRETDSESGTPAAVPLAARTEPARSHVVHAAETGQHDVRVGPGDAGAADAPTHSTRPSAGRTDTWTRAIVILGIAALFAGIFVLLF